MSRIRKFITYILTISVSSALIGVFASDQAAYSQNNNQINKHKSKPSATFKPIPTFKRVGGDPVPPGATCYIAGPKIPMYLPDSEQLNRKLINNEKLYKEKKINEKTYKTNRDNLLKQLKKQNGN